MLITNIQPDPDAIDGVGDRLIAAAMHMEMALAALVTHPKFKDAHADNPVIEKLYTDLVACKEISYRIAGNFPMISADFEQENENDGTET